MIYKSYIALWIKNTSESDPPSYEATSLQINKPSFLLRSTSYLSLLKAEKKLKLNTIQSSITHKKKTLPKAAFFWDYSGMRIHGIDGNCVLLGPTVFCFKNERNSGLLGKTEQPVNYNHSLLPIFVRLSLGKMHTQTSSVSLPQFFVTAAILFSEHHKVCSFGN